MAVQKVELQFTGDATPLTQATDQMARDIAELGVVHKRVQQEIQGDINASSESVKEFNSDVTLTSKVVVDLGRAAASGTGQIAGNLDKASKSASTLSREVGGVVVRAKEGTAATRAMGAEQDGVTRKVKLTADQYQAITQRLREIGTAEDQIIGKVDELLAGGQDFAAVMASLQEPVDATTEGVEGLFQQLRAARREAAEMAAAFGVDSQQAIDAQKRVAGLANEVENLNKRFQAFDPGKRFEALNQLSFSLISGLSAVQGIASTLGGDNAALQQMLFVLQSILFAGTGIQQFLGGFTDSLRTLRAVLIGNTAVTQANTTAQAANAAATGAAGTAAVTTSGSFGILTTSVRAFTASLVTNPLFLFVAAVAALAAILASAGSEAEAAKKRFDQLAESADAFREIGDAAADMRRELDELDIDRRRNLLQDSDFEGQARLARESAQAELDAIRSKESARRADIASRQDQLNRLSAIGKLDAEEFKERQDAITRLEIEANGLRAQQNLVRARLVSQLQQIEKDALEEAKADARARRALQEEILLAQRELDQRLREQARESAGATDPFLRAELERRAGLEEIKELEQGFKRKIAAIELQKAIGRKAFEELSEIEREARLDALITDQDIQLPARQQEQVNFLIELENREFERKTLEATLQLAEARAEIMQDGAEKEAAVFRAGQERQLADLRAKGVDEMDIREAQQRDLEAFTQKAANDAIQQDAALQEAIINGRQRGTETEKAFERQKQLDLLAVKIAAAQASLRVLVDNGTAERALVRANLKATIEGLQQELESLLSTPLNINILDLIGIPVAQQAQVQQAVGLFVANFRSAIDAIIAADQAALQAQISTTDQMISDAQRRRSELEAQLDEELRDQEAGRASNVAAIKQSIAEAQAAEKQALEEKKRLVDEQAKLARKQAAIGAIEQSSSLLSAGAKLFEKGAFAGPGGIIIAIATIASMIASFIALSAKVRQATAQSGQAFYKGTERVRRAPGERPGIDTVRAMLTEDEAVIPVAPANKFRRLIRGMITDDYRNLTLGDITPILARMNIRVDDKAMARFSEQRLGLPQFAMDTSGIERRSDVLTDEVRQFRERILARESDERNGRERVERKGSTTIRSSR